MGRGTPRGATQIRLVWTGYTSWINRILKKAFHPLGRNALTLR